MRLPIRCALSITSMLALVPAQDMDDVLVTGIRDDAYFHIESHDATDGDVELARTILREAIVRLRATFGSECTDRPLLGVDCNVQLWAQPTTQIPEGEAVVNANAGEAGHSASIDVVAPSQRSRDPATDQIALRNQFARLLTRAYATILLDRITRQKPSGWTFFAGPSWMTRGYPEYIGVTLSGRCNRDAVLAASLRRQDDPDRVRFHPDFCVQDPCIDGAVIVHFLHETFGPQRVRALLAAPQPTFEAAFLATFGSDLKQLEPRWKAWRDEVLTTVDWVAAVKHADSDRQVAEAVLGQDLKHLPDEIRARAMDALRALAGRSEYWRQPADGSPHRLLRCESGAARFLLLVTGEELMCAWLAVHLFDSNWQQLAVIRFPTGGRMQLVDAWQERVDAVPRPLIALRMVSTAFPLVERQYYAVHEDRVALVRIEKEGGDVCRALFGSLRPTNGPPPVPRTAEQWIDCLKGDDSAAVLETLTWLAGRHLSSFTPRSPDVDQESVESSRLWESVRDDPRTRDKLAELAKSREPWLRDAAQLVLRRE